MLRSDSARCQIQKDEQVFYQKSSVRSRRHSGHEAMFASWPEVTRSAQIAAASNAVSECWQLKAGVTDDLSQKRQREIEKQATDRSTPGRAIVNLDGTFLESTSASGTPRRSNKAWALVVVLMILLSLSLAFNIYCMVVRSQLVEMRLKLSSEGQLQEGSPFASVSRFSYDGVDPRRGRSLMEESLRRISSSSSGSSNGDHGGPDKHDVLLFLFNALVVGTAVVHITSLPAFHGVQQTVVIFVLGLGYSLVQEGLKVKDDIGVFGDSYDMWMDIDPHLLLFTLLPPLIAGDAMAIDTNVAKRVAHQCIYLASVGVLINGMLTALFLMVYLGWSFLLSLATGAILCATDPVAVVALLKELGASPTLTVQIQGESLLNDGTAIVLFTIAYNMIQGVEYDTSEIIMFLIKTALMAWGLGLLIGYVFFVWIQSAGNRLNHSSTIIQISLTICCAYWSFVMAEGVFHISGVLSTVAASLVLASKMWPHIVCEEAMHDVWDSFESLGNIVIFFLAGALTGNTMVHIDVIDYLHLLVIYLVLMIIRTGLIFASRPLLAWLGKEKRPVSVAEAAVMSWGGLRGAVGLALAVQVRIQRAKDDGGIYNISEKDADRILFFVAGVALLTLVINATSCPALVKKLGISAPISAKKDLQKMLCKQIIVLSQSKCHRPEVIDSIATLLEEVTDKIENEKSIKKGSSCGVALHKSLEATAHSTGLIEELHENREHFQKVGSQKELETLGMVASAVMAKQEAHLETLLRNSTINWGRADAVIAAFLALLNSAYWHFLETRDMMPGSKEAEVLLTSVAFARSQLGGELVDFDFVFPHAQVGPEEELLYVINESDLNRASPRKRAGAGSAQYRLWQKVQFRFFRIVETAEFIVFFAAAVVLNGIFLAVEDIYRDDANDTHFVWFAVEVLFVVLFTIEVLLKLLAFGKVYFFDGWNNFDLLLVILGLAGLLVSRLAQSEDVANNSDVSNEARIVRFSKILKVVRLLRLFRLVRFWKRIQAYLTRMDMSFEVADYMKKMTILQCFIKAHLRAQSEFYKYFCGDPTQEELIQSAEVARCMLRSQVFVYRASVLADAHLQELDASFVHEVNSIRKSKVVTEELENFVLSAFHKGVLNSREAEAIIIPLHVHIKECMQFIQKSASGLKLSRLSADTEVFERSDHVVDWTQDTDMKSCKQEEDRVTVWTQDIDMKSFEQVNDRVTVGTQASDLKSFQQVLDKLERCEQVEVVEFEEQNLESAPASSTDPFQPVVASRRD